MRYNPKDEPEDKLLEPGVYRAVVSAARETVSKNGNEMLELVLRIYDQNGDSVMVFDNLVNTPKALWKIRRFCDSAGLKYDAGELTPHQVIDCNVGIKTEIDKQPGYAEKTKVIDYLPATGQPTKVGFPEDDIPF